jgi:hypothetical protein
MGTVDGCEEELKIVLQVASAGTTAAGPHESANGVTLRLKLQPARVAVLDGILDGIHEACQFPVGRYRRHDPRRFARHLSNLGLQLVGKADNLSTFSLARARSPRRLRSDSGSDSRRQR